jgi:hypothetical protein
MGRRAQDRPQVRVRVHFETTRLSGCVLAQSYEYVTPIRQQRRQSISCTTDEGTDHHTDLAVTEARG